MKTTVPREKTILAVADEVWVATALLHREHPDQADFTIREIVARAERQRIHPVLRPGVYVHAVQHCVANRPPNPGRYRMLYETRPGYRRLFRPGDDWHPLRSGSKTTPRVDDLPASYRELIAWYRERFSSSEHAAVTDPILALRGVGRDLWTGSDPDEYVRALRRGWE